MLPYQCHRFSWGSGTLRCSAVQTHKSVVATQADSILNVPRLSGSLTQPLRSVELPKMKLITSCTFPDAEGLVCEIVLIVSVDPGIHRYLSPRPMSYRHDRTYTSQGRPKQLPTDKRSRLGEAATSRNPYTFMVGGMVANRQLGLASVTAKLQAKTQPGFIPGHCLVTRSLCSLTVCLEFHQAVICL